VLERRHAIHGSFARTEVVEQFAEGGLVQNRTRAVLTRAVSRSRRAHA
jgi:hypothetical protein